MRHIFVKDILPLRVEIASSKVSLDRGLYSSDRSQLCAIASSIQTYSENGRDLGNISPSIVPPEPRNVDLLMIESPLLFMFRRGDWCIDIEFFEASGSILFT